MPYALKLRYGNRLILDIVLSHGANRGLSDFELGTCFANSQKYGGQIYTVE